MSRSLKKGDFFPPYFFKLDGLLPSFKLYNRSAFIPHQFFANKPELLVYNGKSFKQITLTDLLSPHRFGEFAPTRAVYVPKAPKKKIIKKTAKKAIKKIKKTNKK